MFKYLTLFILLSTSVAHGHYFYSKYCCNDLDCAPVPCDRLIENDKGQVTLHRDGKLYVFPKEHTYPSEDNQCHACILGDQPRCVYIQQGS